MRPADQAESERKRPSDQLAAQRDSRSAEKRTAESAPTGGALLVFFKNL